MKLSEFYMIQTEANKLLDNSKIKSTKYCNKISSCSDCKYDSCADCILEYLKDNDIEI